MTATSAVPVRDGANCRHRFAVGENAAALYRGGRHGPSSARLAAYAVWALREEALLTPKPALVDRRGSGAHRDMSLNLLLHSATVLEPMFERIGDAAAVLPFGLGLRRRLAAIGVEGERAMLAATGGVNTHRGAIWSLGLMCAAAARCDAADRAAQDLDYAQRICAEAGRIARLPIAAVATPSHGRIAFARYGARGARGQAEDGFPNIYNVALPALRAARKRGLPESAARLDTLLALIADVEDTCLLHRGGRAALAAARSLARRVRAAGVETARGRQALRRLERELLERNASPGGSADLLAATLLVDRLATAMEEHDGNS